ncbi:hypothetical protein [Streptococcus dentiloxodontae]
MKLFSLQKLASYKRTFNFLVAMYLSLINLFITVTIVLYNSQTNISPHRLAAAVAAYLIIRNIIYKICRLLGYHAKAALTYYSSNEDGYIALPSFEKIDSAYQEHYCKRDIFL